MNLEVQITADEAATAAVSVLPHTAFGAAALSVI